MRGDDVEKKDGQAAEKSYFEYVDDDIPIPSETPGFLMEMVDHCERCALMDDVVFYNWAEILDITCKNAYANGEISKALWKTLAKRYRIWYS